MNEDLLLWIVLVTAGVAILLVVVPTLVFGAPPTPSSRAVRHCVRDMLAGLNLPEGAVYDLGSGWGGMARMLAKHYSERQVIGIERSFLPWLVSFLVQKTVGPGNLRFQLGDFRRMELSNAGAIVCYLGPDLSSSVEDTVHATGTTRCLIVSCFFALNGLTLVEKRTARDLYRTPVYIYQV